MKQFKIAIHPAGATVLLAAFLFCDSHIVLASMLALLIHECGHILIMLSCGIRDYTIELTPFGGMVDSQSFDTYLPWKRAFSAAAGIVASAVSAGICIAFAPRTVFIKEFIKANLSLAFFNTLPAWPLDGARVLTALAASVNLEESVKKIMIFITWIISVVIVVAALIGVWFRMFNPTMLLIGPYLCYATSMERITGRVRQIEYTAKKLQYQTIMPVALWVSEEEKTEKIFESMGNRIRSDKYHIVLNVNRMNGEIQKCMTEKQMIKELVEGGKN